MAETEVRAAAGVSQDREEAAADNRSPVSVVPVEEDSPAVNPAVSLSRVNAARADSPSRVAADFRAEAASPVADKVSLVAADSPVAGRDSPASVASPEAKDSGAAIVAISAAVITIISVVAIADIIAEAVIMAAAPTDMGMGITRATATTAVIMADLIATPMATMTSGAIGIQIPTAVTTLTPTDTATSGH